MNAQRREPALKQQWRQLLARFAALKPREQVLITVAGLAIVLALCDQLLWEPTGHAIAVRRHQITAAQKQLHELRAAHRELETKLAEDPDAELHRSIDAVDANIARQNTQLAKLTVNLIPPQAMAGVLRKVLAKSHKLQLLSLHNEPAAPAFKPEAASAGGDDTKVAPVVTIYRHGLTLKFKGRYFDTVDYLHALEQLPWHFYWEKLDYKVEHYPDAVVTLKVYTLSNRENWIGA